MAILSLSDFHKISRAEGPKRTDGITTLTASNSTIFGGIGVSGDGLGNISRWVIEVQGTSSPVEMETLFFTDGSSTDSSAYFSEQAYVSRNPGTWSTTAVITPEPSDLALQLVGYVFAGLALRKLRRVPKT